MPNEVICPYCCMGALRMTGRELYPAKPEHANKHYFACRNCDAWIGCKDGTWEPVGRLADAALRRAKQRSEEHTSELQSLMRISYDVFCLTKKKTTSNLTNILFY